MDVNINLLPCIYFTAYENGIVRNINDKVCADLGYEKSELKGQKTDVFFTLATRIFHQTHIYPLLKLKGFCEEIFLSLQARSGDLLPVLFNITINRSQPNIYFEYVGIVVHNRKKFEEELIESKKLAESALNENKALNEIKNKLQKHLEQMDQQLALIKRQKEEIIQFNRVVTHDLQEPLRKLLVFSNRILFKENPQVPDENIAKLKKVTEQMRSILSGLQNYIWLADKTVVPDKVNIEDLVKECIHKMQTENDKLKIQLEIKNIPEIEADKDQMKLLIFELISNSVNFRKPGNDVFLNISATSLLLNKFRNISDKYIYVDYLKIQFSDMGIGFDSIYKSQLFGLFKKLHYHSGRGVGLSLCRKIIENHNGQIEIEGNINMGCTVTIFLPFQPEKTNQE